MFPTSFQIFFTILLHNTHHTLSFHPESSSESEDSCFHHNFCASISEALSLSIVVLYLCTKREEDKN
jgi:hypothetical protein